MKVQERTPSSSLEISVALESLQDVIVVVSIFETNTCTGLNVQYVTVRQKL